MDREMTSPQSSAGRPPQALRSLVGRVPLRRPTRLTIGRIAALAALAAFFGTFQLGAGRTAAQTVTQTFAPVADAYVSSSRPTQNYGSANRLKVDQDSPVLTAYLRFSPSNLAGTVTSATLQVYSRNTSSMGLDLRSVASNAWGESSITFANAPAFSTTSAGMSTPVKSGAWTSIDVTKLVSGNGPVSIALTTPSTSALDVDSRQGPRPPKLTIETTSTDTTPPSAPGSPAVTATTATSLGLSWTASTDDTGVAGYDVLVNGTAVATSPTTSYTFTGLTCGATYTLAVDAYDASGNHSAPATISAATSACSADTQPPTTPGSLTVSNKTSASLSVSWQASTDDTGVAGYDVFVNGTKAGTTVATTYPLSGLTCGTAYTIGVEAFDAAGNRSTRATTSATTNACPDTHPPSAPSGLTPSAATQTSVVLSWTASTDDVGVAGYDLYANGTKAGTTTTATSYTFAGLTCGTSYTLGVQAFDAAGNRSTLATVTAATAVCPTGGGGAAPAFRYAYFSDSDPAANQALGATLIDVGSKWSADQLPAGLKGMVWVGDYDNGTCSWEVSDASLTSTITAAKGDAKVYGWFISDEPNPVACPNAPAQHAARSALIHSIDPGTKTFEVLDSNGFSGNLTQDAIDQIPQWVGTADFIGLDPYPCLAGKSCNYTFLKNMIAKADAAGIPYVGVLQAFDSTNIGEQFRLPTASELQAMVSIWAASHEAGSAYFAWDWPTASWQLSAHPDLEAVIQSFWTGTASSPADTTPPSAPGGLVQTGSTTTSVSLSWTASTDDTGVTGYTVSNGNSTAGTTAGTTYTVGSLTCGTTYTFGVTASDAAGNVSTKSTISGSTSACPSDTTAPSAPTQLAPTGATATTVSVSWAASTDNVGVTGYDLYSNGTKVGTTTGTTYSFTGLTCGTSYTFGVVAFDAAGNRSTRPTTTGSTTACDTLAPTAPGSPAVTTATTTAVTVWWSPSLDNVGVTGYDLYSNGSKAGTTAGTSYTFGGLACGTTYTFGVVAFDAAGNRSATSSVGGATAACATGSNDPVITAAGDICGSPTDCAPTEKLLESINPTRVLTLGDNAYSTGSPTDYQNNYAPNWGKQLARTSPAPGNHEYDYDSTASGYFGYFGAQAPAPYYSYDIGTWHLISLNGELSHSAGSAEETWLKSDLAAHPAQCILAYWHEPRFSSGAEHGSDSSFDPFWRDLYAAGADIVLNGHDHEYERFAPQNPSAVADPKGIREFVVGTGGDSHYLFAAPIANSEIRDNTSFGVLKLTLHASSYDWQFVPVAGATFSDAGSGTC
jgi:chitodextrinase